MPAADFLMLIYLDFGMILDGFCVIPSAEEEPREKQLPLRTRDLQSGREVSHMSFLIVCLFYRGHAAISHGRDCQHNHHPCCYHDTF